MRATANKILACSVAVLVALNAAAGESININRLVDEKPAAPKPAQKNIENLDLRTDYAAALADNAKAGATGATPAAKETAAAKAASDIKKPRNEKPVLEDRFAKGTRRVGAFGGMA